MTPLPSNNEEWQAFLRQNRPTPPPATSNFEECLMQAVETTRSPALNRRLLAVPPAIAAGLLMVWSGYRTLIPLPEPSYSANLEAFLENNWQNVVGESPANFQHNSTPTEWLSLVQTTP